MNADCTGELTYPNLFGGFNVEKSPDCSMQAMMQTDALPGATILTRGVAYDNGKELFGGPLVTYFGGEPVVGGFVGFACHMTRFGR